MDPQPCTHRLHLGSFLPHSGLFCRENLAPEAQQGRFFSTSERSRKVSAHLQRASQAVSIPAVLGGTRLKALAPKGHFWRSFWEARIIHSGLRLFAATLELQPKCAITQSLEGIQDKPRYSPHFQGCSSKLPEAEPTPLGQDPFTSRLSQPTWKPKQHSTDPTTQPKPQTSLG